MVGRVDGVSTRATSLKRKREDADDNDDLYGDSDSTKRKLREGREDQMTLEFTPNGSNTTANDETEWLMFLVSENGELQVPIPLSCANAQIRRIADMDILFTCDDFATLPKVLCPESDDLLAGKKALISVEEILLANLGDSHVEPHLLVSLINMNVLTSLRFAQS